MSSDGNQAAPCSPGFPTAFLSYPKLALGFHGTPRPHNLIINPPFWFKQTFERIVVGGQEEED